MSTEGRRETGVRSVPFGSQMKLRHWIKLNEVTRSVSLALRLIDGGVKV
jgi:hypothetical protein